VMNPATPANPTPQIATVPQPYQLTVLDPGQPIINQVVNSASFLPTSYFSGTPASNNPNTTGGPTVSPGEIISIFGVNLGPSSVITASPQNGVFPKQITFTGSTSIVSAVVDFTFTAIIPPATKANQVTEQAPMIMFTSNQINVMAPYDLQYATPAGGATATIQATIITTDLGGTITGGGTTLITPQSTLLVLPEDPGLFTFGGAGQGQAAVQNQDYSINGTKNPAARGSTIQVFATGLGTLLNAPAQDGVVATGPDSLSDQTVVAEIDGQPANVSYAGTSPGSIEGLIQINVVVPPTSATGAAIPITIAIGPSATAHRTQAGATICVK